MIATFAEDFQSVLDAVASGAKSVTDVDVKPNGNHEAVAVFPQGTITVRGSEADRSIAIVLNVGVHAGHCDAVAEFMDAVKAPVKTNQVEATNGEDKPKRSRSKS